MYRIGSVSSPITRRAVLKFMLCYWFIGKKESPGVGMTQEEISECRLHDVMYWNAIINLNHSFPSLFAFHSSVSSRLIFLRLPFLPHSKSNKQWRQTTTEWNRNSTLTNNRRESLSSHRRSPTTSKTLSLPFVVADAFRNELQSIFLTFHHTSRPPNWLASSFVFEAAKAWKGALFSCL